MGVNEPIGELADAGELDGIGEDLDVAGPVQQLVFQGKIGQQRLL